MASVVEQEYTFATVSRILGVAEAKLRYWSQSGFVGPSRRRGARQTYTFQDLVAVRAAKELVERGFAPAQIRKALDAVRAALPAVNRPLERLRVAWDGNTLALVTDGAAFEVNGQRLFDFGLGDLAARAASVAALPTPRPTLTNPDGIERSAYQWFTFALAQEASGKFDEAVAAYRQALAADPGLSAAHTNLGALAYNAGDAGAARASFEAALALDPEQAEARYNLATALENLGSQRQAVEHLRRYMALAADGGEELAPWVEEALARLERLQA